MLNTTSPIICIAGPTASGKSQLALDYVQYLATKGVVAELICVDSATIYRGMDIGTAKPSLSERALCPHHLIDIKDPCQSYSAGEFARDATALIHAIRARGHEPVLVGGTMLYFKALIEGIDALPVAHPEIRAQIEQEAQAEGWPALHARLGLVDAPTAARLAPNDGQRIGRALEVWRATGRALSSYFEKDARRGADSQDLLPFRLVALEPSSRQVLHDRIAARFDAMLAAGFVEEVRRLKADPALDAGLPSMRCVGYRQVWEFLEGACSEAVMRERAIAATRQLAKRQLTWLRSWEGKISLSQVGATNAGIVEQIAGFAV